MKFVSDEVFQTNLEEMLMKLGFIKLSFGPTKRVFITHLNGTILDQTNLGLFTVGLISGSTIFDESTNLKTLSAL